MSGGRASLASVGAVRWPAVLTSHVKMAMASWRALVPLWFPDAALLVAICPVCPPQYDRMQWFAGESTKSAAEL